MYEIYISIKIFLQVEFFEIEVLEKWENIKKLSKIFVSNDNRKI